jgi:hypothetical protein
MWQTGERVFISILQGRQRPVVPRCKTTTTYHDTLHLFCGDIPRQEAEEGMFSRTSHVVQDRAAHISRTVTNPERRDSKSRAKSAYLDAPGTWLCCVVLASAERSCKDNNLARFITRLSLTMSTDASLPIFLFFYPLVVPYLFYSFSLCSFSYLSANSQVTSPNLSWRPPI